MHEGLAHMYATSKSWFPLKHLRDYLTAEGTRSIFSLATNSSGNWKYDLSLRVSLRLCLPTG